MKIKSLARKLLTGFLLAVIVLTMVALPVLAMTGLGYFTITESSGTTYTNYPIIVDVNNSALAASGNISATGLDTRVKRLGTELPHMLADNKTLFVGGIPPSASTVFQYSAGNTALDSFKIISGYSGNVSTSDSPTLELGRSFDVSVSLYVDATGTAGNSVLYKQGAVKFNISAANTLTFHALNADDTDNWTMTGAITSGLHTIRAYADGIAAHLYVDSVEIDTENLYISNNVIINSSGSTIHDRSNFYVAGRYWAFTTNGTDGNVYFTSSTDGATWATATAITSDNANNSANTFALWLDSTDNVSYARRSGAGKSLAYRKGAPQASGTITWLAAEQTVGTWVGDVTMGAVSIAVSSGGTPWIAYSRNTGWYNHWVDRSTTTDGTWTSDAGYPFLINSNYAEGGLKIVPMLANKMYLAWLGDSDTAIPVNMYGRLYGGGVWAGSDELIVGADGTDHIHQFSMVADSSDRVHVLFRRSTAADTSTRIGYVRRTGGAWSTNTYLATGGGGTSYYVAATYDATADVVNIFYTKAALGVYMRYLSGTTWADEIYLVNANVSGSSTISSNYQAQSSRISFLYKNAVAGFAEHAYLYFQWVWNDNSNTWYWLSGNVAPYADNITMSVSGVQQLLYKPNAIISGTILPDRTALGHTGTFHWGANSAGITGVYTPSVWGVETDPATNIGSSTVTLNGLLTGVNGYASVSVYFEYGTTVGYGDHTTFQTKTEGTAFSAAVTGLQYNTTYHFRAVAQSVDDTMVGEDLTFTTNSTGSSTTVSIISNTARVFSNYLEPNDLLFVAETLVVYPPYYPVQSVKDYFTLQVIDTDNTTILAATPIQFWGDSPEALYMRAAQAASINQTGSYIIRLKGNFAGAPTTQYQLQVKDWRGYDLTKLDEWCISIASNMQLSYKVSMLAVLGDRGTVVNDTGTGYFTVGVPGIDQVRPYLFTTSQIRSRFTMGVNNNTWDNTTAWQTNVGSYIAADAVDFGAPFGLGGRDLLAGGIAIVMLGIIGMGTAAMGGFGALGLLLICIPILWVGTYFKIMPVQIILIITIIFGILAVRQFWIKTT